MPGLDHRWRHGRAELEHGSLVLRPFLGGLRLLPQDPVTVHVASSSVGPRAVERRSPRRSAFAVSPAARLVEVTTHTGAVVQLAVLPPAFDAVVGLLGSDAPAPPHPPPDRPGRSYPS